MENTASQAAFSLRWGPILPTKLSPPRVSQKIVHRPRLIEKLNQGLNRKLTLILTPAGFGKTTLLRAWQGATEHVRPGAWLSLDEEDSDLHRFWSYFVAALESAHPGVAEDALALLRSPSPPADLFLAALIKAIIAVPFDFTMVVDDYHEVQSESVHQFLSVLLEHLPSNIHLIITTRVIPPFPLARLRTTGELIEIGVDDLRFNQNEAAAYFNDILRLALPDDAVAALERRMEGWAAGLKLAALAMEGNQDVAAFLATFTGSHRYIIDYLAEEVLQRQSEPVQRFLMETSILDRLHPQLCDAVVEDRDSLAILKLLEQGDLFITPVDHQGRWYRYHQVFAHVMRTRLQETRPEAVPQLHRRASLWYQRNGITDHAIRHALAAGAHELAADLVEQAADHLWLRTEMEQLKGWLASLPAHVVQSRPILRMVRALTLTAAGRVETAELEVLSALQDRSHPDSPPGGALGHKANAFLAFLAFKRGDIVAACDLVLGILEGLPLIDTNLRCLLAVTLSGMLDHCQEGAAAAEAYAESTGQQADEELYLALMALRLQAKLLQMGDAPTQVGPLARLLRSVDARSDSPLSLTGWGYWTLAACKFGQNDWNGAESDLSVCIDRGRRGGRNDLLVHGYTLLARIRHARGDLHGQSAAMVQAERLAVEPAAPRPHTPSGATLLSNREQEVLALIAAGLSNQEIAAHAGLALNTVKRHSSNIFGKLGVGSRTQAVARARELGLL